LFGAKFCVCGNFASDDHMLVRWPAAALPHQAAHTSGAIFRCSSALSVPVTCCSHTAQTAFASRSAAIPIPILQTTSHSSSLLQGGRRWKKPPLS
jgi:hypothetical protein